ncbi:MULTISPECIES: DUF29 domain-containing protein [Okeania]|uniref:DUF29 domain-containing protein n=1 Tax=Okeania hirsuta TaxID=1458930 RepID=A0A3N6NAT2_9CYAN|nr:MULTISPECIES: DUF29 domain-containing protein [Okeania]NEP05081.1 DUF29 domain-containing protein [Okeania sp. SIO4D6]NEP44415.1 DUF29 domain-containing protein [Okeania sp. SIO2H7]NET15999.1 DUF29 domain-containing protein [Okeania sp. SIO1H6]NEP72211.1 DUF29 domain-containing protein [Okeania sp. SIO2G5]NEP94672.1 DUF29 domain-containing protein [Okeania sp. SIO2F5]
MSSIDETTETHEITKMTNLYETDFVEWTIKQAQALNDHDLKALDWNNLKEEIEDLGKEQIHAVSSFIKRLIEHKLKLDYSSNIYPRNHWQTEINNFQDEIERRLTKTLLNKVDIDKEYERAKRLVLSEYKLDLPDQCPYTFADLMQRLPEN